MALGSVPTTSSPILVARNISQGQTSSTVSNIEGECWRICLDRFKYIIPWIWITQYLLLMLYSIMVNFTYLHPISWFKEIFSLTNLILVALVLLYEYIRLKTTLEEKVYYSTKISKFIKSFTRESSLFLLNLAIGLFTSVLFIRRLNEHFNTFATKGHEKQLLNEKFIFILFNGAFIRCYFYLRKLNVDETFTFPIIHQSKLLQLRRQFVTVLKSSFISALFPTIHYFGFHIVFGGSYCYLMSRMLGLNDSSILGSIVTIIDPRVIAFSWVQSAFVWSYMELMHNIVNIYMTEPKQLPIEATSTMNLSDVLTLSKWQIVQQLAAQDLYLLADNPNNNRRRQVYTLSNPGGHPHNWKNLVQKSLDIIDNFTEELKKTIDLASKNRNINNNVSRNMYQPVHQFYESKRIVRLHNDFTGIRSLASSPLNLEPPPIEKKASIVNAMKQTLISNRFIFYFFGENDTAKLNFILNQNCQTVAWITQGISAIIARSIKEDSYGVVHHDIKKVLKSLIKLKTVLDKVGTVTIVAKDRELLALKAAVRRSMYRIVAEFSEFFEDLMLDSEDVRNLHTFITYKEL